MVNPEPLQKKERLPGLDGLRALAALCVFSVHFNQIVQLDGDIGPFNVYRLMANGKHAVSLFLSLSGFLLSLPFWNWVVSGKPLPATRNYLIRRLSRILPAYYVVLTALVLLSGLWRVPDAYVDIRDWKPARWKEHQELARDLAADGHGQLVGESVAGGIFDEFVAPLLPEASDSKSSWWGDGGN